MTYSRQRVKKILLKEINSKAKGANPPAGSGVFQAGKFLEHPESFLDPLGVGLGQISESPMRTSCPPSIGPADILSGIPRLQQLADRKLLGDLVQIIAQSLASPGQSGGGKNQAGYLLTDPQPLSGPIQVGIQHAKEGLRGSDPSPRGQTPFGFHALILRMRWRRRVVECPVRYGMRSTFPPQYSTRSLPTTSLALQSPPLARRSGWRVWIT